MNNTVGKSYDYNRLYSTIEALRYHLEFLVGTRDHATLVKIAEQWVEAGIATDNIDGWAQSGVFCADSCAQLRDRGLSPADCAKDSTHLAAHSIGYAYSNNDCSLDEAVEDAAK